LFSLLLFYTGSNNVSSRNNLLCWLIYQCLYESFITGARQLLVHHRVHVIKGEREEQERLCVESYVTLSNDVILHASSISHFVCRACFGISEFSHFVVSYCHIYEHHRKLKVAKTDLYVIFFSIYFTFPYHRTILDWNADIMQIFLFYICPFSTHSHQSYTSVSKYDIPSYQCANNIPK
jgi:hypothetical protein